MTGGFYQVYHLHLVQNSIAETHTRRTRVAGTNHTEPRTCGPIVPWRTYLFDVLYGSLTIQPVEIILCIDKDDRLTVSQISGASNVLPPQSLSQVLHMFADIR